MELSRREHYCEHLGINQWYARKQLLLGASAPSLYEQAADYPQDSDDAVHLLSKPASTTAPLPLVNNGSHGGGAKALLRDVAGAPEDSTGEGEAEGAEQVVSAEPQPQLSLRAYKFGPVLISTSMAQDRPDAAERALAQAIAKAYLGDEFGLEYYGVFEWPLFEQNQVQAHVANSVTPYISRWWAECYQKNVKQHLCFGDVALPEQATVDALNVIGFEYALSELLLSPGLKQDYWRKLVSARSNKGGRIGS